MFCKTRAYLSCALDIFILSFCKRFLENVFQQCTLHEIPETVFQYNVPRQVKIVMVIFYVKSSFYFPKGLLSIMFETFDPSVLQGHRFHWNIGTLRVMGLWTTGHSRGIGTRKLRLLFQEHDPRGKNNPLLCIRYKCILCSCPQQLKR